MFSAFVLALCVAQVTLAEQNVATTESGLNSLLKSGGEAFESIHQAFLNIAGVKNDAELFSKVEGQVKTFGSTLSNQVAQLREETKGQTGKVQELFKEFQDKVTQKAEEFKANNPEFFSGDADKFQEGVEKRYRLVLQETEDLRKKLSAEGENISGKTQKLLDDIATQTVNSAKDLQKQFEAATTDGKKN